MRAASLLLLLLWQAGAASDAPIAHPDAMQYMRAIRVPAGAGQACAVLDAGIFPHAAPSLADLRIFPAGDAAAREIPYAITMSEALTEQTQPARLLNLGSAAGKIAFDLEMPQRAYTSVTLQIDPAVHDFLATATVIGTNWVGPAGSRDKSIGLGTFTLFDLTAQHLSRDTTLPLDESTFRYLHILLSLSAAPGATAPAGGFAPAMVQGAEVPPSREAQILYTTVAETASIATVGRESIAKFEIPPRVPVEWVSFTLPPGFKGNFSRDVRVTAKTEPPAKGAARSTSDPDDGGMENDERAPLPEVVTGSILRVHTTQAGREIRTDQLGIPAILGANLQRPAQVEVAIENGDDQPLPIASVRLQMRQRKICFDAPAAAGAAGGPTLYYGDPRLVAPVYDYERLFVASSKPLTAELGPETPNPHYSPPPTPQRPFTERHPELLWIALIVVICALGVVAFKSSRHVGR